MESKQKRKQRKRHFTAPLHKRRAKVSAALDKGLRTKYGKRNVPVVVGDTVKVMRGDFAGRQEKVTEVDRKKYRLTVKGVTLKKANGEEVPRPINTSNVMIVELNLEDGWRAKALMRGSPVQASVEAKATK